METLNELAADTADFAANEYTLEQLRQEAEHDLNAPEDGPYRPGEDPGIDL